MFHVLKKLNRVLGEQNLLFTIVISEAIVLVNNGNYLVHIEYLILI